MLFDTFLEATRLENIPLYTFDPAPDYPTMRAGREESNAPTIVLWT